MNLVCKDGKGGNEAVVYERASADVLVHMIRRKDESKSMVHDSNLRLIDHLYLLNIPSTSFYHRNEVEKCLSYEEAQSLS